MAHGQPNPFSPLITDSDKRNLGLKEIAKRVRTQIKAEFPREKFSVTTEYYANGQSLHITLVASGRHIVRRFAELDGETITKYHDGGYRNNEDLRQMCNGSYFQLNSKIHGDYDPTVWCNGCFLSEEGHGLMLRVMEIVEQYNYDNSDSQTDYFDVNFYTHLSIGGFDKPFIQVEKANTDTRSTERRSALNTEFKRINKELFWCKLYAFDKSRGMTEKVTEHTTRLTIGWSTIHNVGTDTAQRHIEELTRCILFIEQANNTLKETQED